MPTQIDNPVQQCLKKDPQEKETDQDPLKHWIKFKLLDESGKPVSNVTVQVGLPDGSTAEMNSDEHGMIEINNIDPGSCKILSEWKDMSADQIIYLKS